MVSFKKKKILKLNSKNIYFLVADVKKYPDFLPWCKGIVVKKKTKTRKKRQELSCSATKSIRKEEVKIVVKFD